MNDVNVTNLLVFKCLTTLIIVSLNVLIKYIFSINNIPKRNTLYIEKSNEKIL